MVAQRDDNGSPTMLGISCVDGITPIRIQFSPLGGGMKIDGTTVISVVPSSVISKDGNGANIMRGVSSSDSSVILPFYVNPSTGAVLIDM